MKRVVILKGLQGAGKSTWAKEQLEKYPGTYKRISKDDLRLMLDNGKHSSGREDFILRARDFLILETLSNGQNVLVDDTNLNPIHEERIRELVTAWNQEKAAEGKRERAEVEVKFFDVPLEECIERDKTRPNPVGEAVIRDTYNKYLKKEPLKVQRNPDFSAVIICDIDGTLALHNGRDPYDFEKCESDLLNDTIRLILSKFINDYTYLILVSGREDKYREHTMRWLKLADIRPGALYMRKTGDMRQDTIIKKEIYDEYIKNKYNVLFVLDDRDRVVKMWREQGLVCLQVAEGNF